MMKALLTAEVNNQLVTELENVISIRYEGWVKNGIILTEDELTDLMAGKDILITSYDPVTQKVMDGSPDLRLIVCTRANPVNVDTDYAKAKGIKVSYSPNRNSVSAAEFTVGLILAVTRRIPFAFKALRDGRHLMEAYRDNETKEGLRRDVTWGLGSEAPYVLYKGNQMRGHTLGVIGYGSIGREVAKLCQAFEMRILAYDPFVSQNNAGEGVRMVEMEELLREADIVTIHCKDTPKTNGLIDAAAFSKMKKNAVFINTARGALVDEKALIQALREKQIAGAALDVFDQEPLTKDHPFVAELDNVVITPHLAGATYEAIDNHTRQLISDVKHFITGEPLEYEYR